MLAFGDSSRRYVSRGDSWVLVTLRAKLILHQHQVLSAYVVTARLYVSLKYRLFLCFFFFNLYKMYKMRVYIIISSINFTFLLRGELSRSAKYFLNFPILSTSYPYLLTYEIMEPIWILEIKTSDSVRESCSHLERQSEKVRTERGRGKERKRRKWKICKERNGDIS